MAKTQRKHKIPEGKLTWGFVLKNAVAAVVVITLIFLGISWWLNGYTNHGKTVVVPDLTNMTGKEAAKAARSAGVRATVEDSVFMPKLGKGIVFRQEPRAGLTVKKGRHIRLTANAVIPKKVQMPNLVGYNIMEAKAEIISHGLTIGRLEYVRDIATNVVMEQKVAGRVIRPGTEIISGSEVTLVLGLNPRFGTTVVPNVVGSKFLSAIDGLHDNFLNRGKVVADPDIRTYADSIQAYVYRQDPSPRASRSMGSPVVLYLTKNESKIPTK
ncbi:MAG: PASTA domain-containing protein [Bacteroidales bacterium]|nr:PASTA domain-containing protein [Bacteroidales bacterium]